MLKYTSSITAIGILLTSSAAILATDVAMPIPASAHEDHGRFSAGRPGDPKKPARVVKVKMFEGSGKMGFEPARIAVRRGSKSASFCKTTARRTTNSSSQPLRKIANMQK
jgi:hypothetical protein